MGIDRLKLADLIKIFAFFVYLIYFSFSSTSLVRLHNNTTDLNSDTELKKELLSSKCLLLLGGSNVRMGLSAEAVSFKSCEAVNLGVSGEAGGFEKYSNWLKHNALADKVIYSPADIWRDKLLNNNKEMIIKFPSTSLFAIIRIIIFPIENPTSSEFNKFGDQNRYQCIDSFPSFYIKINDFNESSHLINREIYNRIISLKEITKSDEVFVRVPPVYVKTESQAKLYKKLMDRRIAMLKGLGVKIIGSTIVSTDSSLFCDSFHPNAKGREAFTKEIRLP